MAHWQRKHGEREKMDRIIRQNPGIRPAELARRLGVSRSTVQRRLPTMEEVTLEAVSPTLHKEDKVANSRIKL